MKFRLIDQSEGNRIEEFDTLDAISGAIEGIDWVSGDYRVVDDDGNKYTAEWIVRPSESRGFLGVKVVNIGQYRLVKKVPNKA